MDNLPENFDPANSVLFLGSGFSAGALGVGGDELPTGNPLRDKLAQLLDPEEDWSGTDLQTLAQEFSDPDGENLYDLLYKTFTISKLASDQAAILALPWRRIYTTNYDDAIEYSNKNLKTFSFDDPRPRSLPRQMAVHLHGSIRDTTPSNVLSQLVLNETSYVDQIARPSTWIEEFGRDVRFSDAAYFIGYSLSDHHITAALTRSEAAKRKTFFITREAPTRALQNRLRDVATILPIGRDGFAEFSKKTRKPEALGDVRQLKSLRYIDPFLDRKSAQPITPNEIFNLIVYGRFSLSRFIATFGTSKYVADRLTHVERAVNELFSNRVLFVHSRVGNGKSIFYICSRKR